MYEQSVVNQKHFGIDFCVLSKFCDHSDVTPTEDITSREQTDAHATTRHHTPPQAAHVVHVITCDWKAGRRGFFFTVGTTASGYPIKRKMFLLFTWSTKIDLTG